MDPHAFDRLARNVSQSASRRWVLGGLLGAALSGVAGTGEAKRRHHRHGPERMRGGNSACARFCAQVFGDNSPATGRCISDAARGAGLCAVECEGMPASAVCCVRNSGGFCTDSAAAHCCGAGTTCYQNACCTPKTCTADQCGTTISDGCGGKIDCPACPPTCSARACQAGVSPCGGGPFTLCSSTNPNCACISNVEGDTVCANLNLACNTLPTCTTSDQCPPGSSCFNASCACGDSRCYPCCAG